MQKLSEAYSVIDGAGGLTFTLRLNQDGLICVTGSADPARDMSRRIQRAFKRRALAMPLLAFSLEVTPDEREELHLHGAIASGDVPRETLVAILSEAGGKIEGKAGARQVKLQAFDEGKGGPAGWARYPRKGAVRTLRVLDHHKIIYISQDLKRLGRERWNERRNMVLTSGLPKTSRSFSAKLRVQRLSSLT